MSSDCELNIAIVDDTEADRERTVSLTEQILHQAKIPHWISGYDNARSLLEDLHNGRKFNLLLLDVMMDKMGGIALARELRDQGDQTMIVFISHSQEMARLGYKVDAARYLVKPLEEEELAEALLHSHKVWQVKKEILLPTDRGQRRTSFPEIQYVEAFDRGTRFVLLDEAVETRLKFSEVEAMLPKSTFILCHRAYIVNIAHTKRISQYEFLMKSGAVVPISRLRYNEINRKFVAYLTD